MAAKTEKRRMEIMHYLESEGILYIHDLAQKYQLTHETIRTDLDRIAQENGYERIHGGIKKPIAGTVREHYTFNTKKNTHVAIKKQLVQGALNEIEDGSTLYLDSGSTLYYLIHYFHFKKDITFITPSIPILMAYTTEIDLDAFHALGHRFIFIGGHVDQPLLCTYGIFFQAQLEHLTFDYALFSGDAFNLKQGLCNADESAYAIARHVIKKSDKILVLVDHSKWYLSACYQSIGLKEIHLLVTNHHLNTEETHTLKTHHIQAFLV